MQFKITVSPGDKTANGWFVHYFRWVSVNDPAPDLHLIQGWSVNNGVFSKTIELAPGDYGLSCHVALSGRSVEVDFEPAPEITWPPNATWPFKVEVPATQSQTLETRYFRVGAGQ